MTEVEVSGVGGGWWVCTGCVYVGWWGGHTPTPSLRVSPLFGICSAFLFTCGVEVTLQLGLYFFHR